MRGRDALRALVSKGVDMTDSVHASTTCGCDARVSSDPTHFDRRQVIRISAAAGAAMALGPLAPSPAAARPQAGDLFCGDEVESDPVAIKLSDLQLGKPVLAFPFEPGAKTIRNDSKLNKVVLIKVAEADLDTESKGRAAGGVLAYSAICTHQNCEAKTWVAADKALVCFCHASKFLALESGRVSSGPAPRPLPSLPLKLKGDQLVVAGPFTSPPGGAPT
jgi:rieske iron-sulfur protein